MFCGRHQPARGCRRSKMSWWRMRSRMGWAISEVGQSPGQRGRSAHGRRKLLSNFWEVKVTVAQETYQSDWVCIRCSVPSGSMTLLLSWTVVGRVNRSYQWKARKQKRRKEARRRSEVRTVLIFATTRPILSLRCNVHTYIHIHVSLRIRNMRTLFVLFCRIFLIKLNRNHNYYGQSSVYYTPIISI